ncbi:MAG TPA: hypothetical protein VM408_00130 [Methylomirabilota bacterium]|nr:hypothetical protein [Methylomirabilota bacterium]
MTRSRVIGPSRRTVILDHAAVLVATLFLSGLVIACGTSVAPSAPGPSPTIGLPGSSGGGLPAGSPGVAGPGSSLLRWPGTTVLAVIALGAADGEIDKARADLQKAADAQDLPAMRGAADGLAKMIEALMPNLERLDAYEGTKPVAALYRTAFPEIAAGATRLRDAVAAGDGPGITAGYVRLVEGIKLYGPIRRQIGALVEQAIVQQRLLLQ